MAIKIAKISGLKFGVEENSGDNFSTVDDTSYDVIVTNIQESTSTEETPCKDESGEIIATNIEGKYGELTCNFRIKGTDNLSENQLIALFLNLSDTDFEGLYFITGNSKTRQEGQWMQGSLTARRYFQVTGSELVTNGTFDTDLTGWTAGIWVWDASQRAYAEADILSSFLSQAIVPVIGKSYLITADIEKISSALETQKITFGASSYNLPLGNYTGSISFIAIPSTTLGGLIIDPDGADSIYIDNVSVKELITL